MHLKQCPCSDLYPSPRRLVEVVSRTRHRSRDRARPSAPASRGRARRQGRRQAGRHQLPHRVATPSSRSSPTKIPRGSTILRHSTAHLLAQAVQELFPDAQVTIGPVIENGFYYDFAYKRPFTPEDLAAIEKKMAEHRARRTCRCTRKVMARDEAVEFFRRSGENYKAEIIAAIPGERADLALRRRASASTCAAGRTCPPPASCKVFKLMKRGRRLLARRFARTRCSSASTAPPGRTKEDQDAYLKMLEEAEKRDHRKLGKQLDLFHMQEEAPGLVFWHPKGWTLWQQVEQYMRARVPRQRLPGSDAARRSWTAALWEKSGHWENYRENMFTTDVGEPRLRDQADELPGPRPDLQPGHAQLPRPAAALRRVRRVPPQRAVRRAARPDARARLHAGRRPHLLHRGADPRPSASRFTALLQRSTRISASTTSSTRSRRGPTKRIGVDETLGQRREGAAARRSRASGVELHELPGRGRVLRSEDRVLA